MQRRCVMENVIADNDSRDRLILKNKTEIEQEKEQKFVDLIVEIIVAITLKEYYEKSD